MSARQSARISKIPRISYHEAQADTLDLASDAEEDEDYYIDSSLLSQVIKADLAGEIKNTIYEFALIEQNPLYIEAAKDLKRLRHYTRRVRASGHSSYRKRLCYYPSDWVFPTIDALIGVTNL
ncbi:hypothetical protein SLS57_011506 [Botryosphaeria dothidea]